MLRTAVNAVGEEYGDEGVEIIHRAFIERTVKLGKEQAMKVQDNSLRSFCAALEKGCLGTHKFKKLEDSDTRQAYCFTSCMWADVYKELGAPEIGFWICEGDGPAAKASNPSIGFSRTKTLMQGDECCDHVYYVKNKC